MSNPPLIKEDPAVSTEPQPQSSQPASTVETNADGSESSSTATSGSELIDYDLLGRQVSHCGEYTFQALSKVGKLTEEDAGRITAQYLKHLSQTPKGTPLIDSLQYLVFEAMGKDEIDGRPILLSLTRALINYSKTKVSHITFAHQNENPIEFYTNFPKISEICRIMGVPVIQVSEKDFFTVSSINPFTATAAARLIANEIEAEFSRKPIYFVTTTEFSSWKYICERHFGT